MHQDTQFDDDTIAKCVNKITSSSFQPTTLLTNLSQTELTITISAKPDCRRYFNDSVDESFLTHLNLLVKLDAIFTNMKLNANNQNILHSILTPHY